jgi:hypothetical protein
MVYAVSALAFLVGLASGGALTWWWLRVPDPAAKKKTRKKRRSTRANDEEIRRFHMANNAMMKLIDAERYNDAFIVARNWCNRAPQFVDSWSKLSGGFDVKALPPIEYAAQHLVALRNVDELRRLREVLMAREELKPWQNLLADEIVAAKELDRIFDVVERSPGIVQEAAARKVSAGIRRAVSALHDADLRNLIRRERSGGSYALFRE